MHGAVLADFRLLEVDTLMIGSLIHEDDRKAAFKFKERLLDRQENLCEFRYALLNGEVSYLGKMFTERLLPEVEENVFDVICQDATAKTNNSILTMPSAQPEHLDRADFAPSIKVETSLLEGFWPTEVDAS